jgi:hypothetical protein
VLRTRKYLKFGDFLLMAEQSQIQIIQQFQHFLVSWNVSHRVAVMCITDDACPIDHEKRRHPAKFEQVHFLVVLVCHPIFNIRTANKRNRFQLPVSFKGIRSVGSNGDDLNTPA